MTFEWTTAGFQLSDTCTLELLAWEAYFRSCTNYSAGCIGMTYPRRIIASASNTSNTGSFTWTLPDLFNTAPWHPAHSWFDTPLLRVGCNCADGTECAQDAVAFSVPERMLRITQPSAAATEVWHPGFPVHFVWSTPLVSSYEATCSIKIYSAVNVSCAERAGCPGDRLCYDLGHSIPNFGCFRWTLPETILADCAPPLYVSIDCRLAAFQTVSDIQLFEVLSTDGSVEAPPVPTIQVTEPNAEETWAVGRVVNITWSSTMLPEDTPCELQLWNKVGPGARVG